MCDADLSDARNCNSSSRSVPSSFSFNAPNAFYFETEGFGEILSRTPQRTDAAAREVASLKSGRRFKRVNLKPTIRRRQTSSGDRARRAIRAYLPRLAVPKLARVNPEAALCERFDDENGTRGEWTRQRIVISRELPSVSSFVHRSRRDAMCKQGKLNKIGIYNWCVRKNTRCAGMKFKANNVDLERQALLMCEFCPLSPSTPRCIEKNRSVKSALF